jgi:hypothetical protein
MNIISIIKYPPLNNFEDEIDNFLNVVTSKLNIELIDSGFRYFKEGQGYIVDDDEAKLLKIEIFDNNMLIIYTNKLDFQLIEKVHMNIVGDLTTMFKIPVFRRIGFQFRRAFSGDHINTLDIGKRFLRCFDNETSLMSTIGVDSLDYYRITTSFKQKEYRLNFHIIGNERNDGEIEAVIQVEYNKESAGQLYFHTAYDINKARTISKTHFDTLEEYLKDRCNKKQIE